MGEKQKQKETWSSDFVLIFKKIAWKIIPYFAVETHYVDKYS